MEGREFAPLCAVRFRSLLATNPRIFSYNIKKIAFVCENIANWFL